VKGIGDKLSVRIQEFAQKTPIETWDDLIKVHGVGPKTVEAIKALQHSDDPFGALWIDRALAEIKRAIREGELGQVPYPTHTSLDIPYAKGQDIPVVWLGLVHNRNVRDIFEYNRAKGEEIDLEAMTINGKPIVDPHLNEWMVMVGDDEHDQMGLRVDRYKYPKFRATLWDMRLGKDLLLVKGYKPGFLSTRQIWVNDLWVVDPEI